MSEGTASPYSSTSGIAAPSTISDSYGIPAAPLLVVTDPAGTARNVGARNRLPPLPSSRYSHTRWHELNDNAIMGHELRAPRVREGPDGPGAADSSSRAFSRKFDYRNKVENWENATCVNLSYQDLGDDYQKGNFVRILKRLIRCEKLQLIDNSLTDLSSVLLPSCTHIYLQGNHLKSLKKLPRMPRLRHLTLTNNGIGSLAGLALLRKTNIDSLVLTGNPVVLHDSYRQTVFREIPSLKVLDGIPKLAKDSDVEGNGKAAGCTVS